MKVLLVNTLYAPVEIGGAERVVRRLADALLRLGMSPEVACLASDGKAASDTVSGVPVHRLRQRNVYPMFPVEGRPAALKPLWHAIDSANFAMAAELGRIVDRVRPDVVHTHNVTGFSPLAWRAVARRGIPIVHTLHDHYLLCPRASMSVDGRSCTSRHFVCAAYSVARLAHAGKVNAVVGVSRYILDRHDEYGAFPNASIRRVIVNPTLDASGVSDATDPAPTPLRVGFLGRLEPTKGVDVLLDACSGLPSSGWTLSIAGNGTPQYEAELRARARLNVRFLGRVDAADFLQSIDLLIVPSRWNEPLPLVILEAHAFGVPVIASRMGGMPDVIEESRTGFLVPAGETGALRAALARVVADPSIARSMRPACLAAARRFVPAVVAGEYARLYDEVRATTSRPR